MHVQWSSRQKELLCPFTASLKIVEIFSNFANKKMFFYWFFELFQIYTRKYKTQTVPFIRSCLIQDENSLYKWFAPYFLLLTCFHVNVTRSNGNLTFVQEVCYCPRPWITTKNYFFQQWTTCFVLPLLAC